MNPPSSTTADETPNARVHFGIVLLPNFTLTAFSGFVDMLRLLADEGDFSKPLRCSWSVIGESLHPIRASCGIQITPGETFNTALTCHYLIVVGGLLPPWTSESEAALDFIRRSAAENVTLVGLCTGVFLLMRAQVLTNHRICVSWYHYWDFIERFPDVNPALLVADRLFVIDHQRITCSGGRAAIDVAAAILLRHFKPSTVQKALRVLLVANMDNGDTQQPHPPEIAPAAHPTVKRAILFMEQYLGRALPLDELARKVGLSIRQLQRLFKSEMGVSPQTYAKKMRLRTAAWLLQSSDKTVSDIADYCGFSDASHLGREFKKDFDITPIMYRERSVTARPATDSDD